MEEKRRKREGTGWAGAPITINISSQENYKYLAFHTAG